MQARTGTRRASRDRDFGAGEASISLPPGFGAGAAQARAQSGRRLLRR